MPFACHRAGAQTSVFERSCSGNSERGHPAAPSSVGWGEVASQVLLGKQQLLPQPPGGDTTPSLRWFLWGHILASPIDLNPWTRRAGAELGGFGLCLRWKAARSSARSQNQAPSPAPWGSAATRAGWKKLLITCPPRGHPGAIVPPQARAQRELAVGWGCQSPRPVPPTAKPSTVPDPKTTAEGFSTQQLEAGLETQGLPSHHIFREAAKATARSRGMGDAQHWKAHLLVQRDSSSSEVAKTWSEDAPGSPPAPCQPQSRVEPTPSPSGGLLGDAAGGARMSTEVHWCHGVCAR